VTEKVFRFHSGRLARNFLGLVPLAAFPLVLRLTGHDDPGLIILFGILGFGFVATVIYTAVRFRMTIHDEGIHCRGRLKSRRVDFKDIRGAFIRKGRDKASRFMGPPPFRELVLITDESKFVISSLPLGPDAFDSLLTILASKLPDHVLDAQSGRSEAAVATQ